jgi:diguanylate cyclase (GGDEF)-like protein/PAS domain S-box-containing protein
MNDRDRSVLAQLIKLLSVIQAGRPVPMDAIETGGCDSDEVRALAASVAALRQQYNDGYRFILDLARGELDTTPPRGNSLVTPFKQLHSELLHLTWQIQQIADGDYEQEVHFSGDFSEAINKLIASLKEKERLDALNKENERLFQTIFDTSPDGMLITDLAGNIQVISNFGEQILGITEADVQVGVFNLFDFVVEDDRQRAFSMISDLSQGRSQGFGAYRVRRKDGQVFWFESSAQLLYGEDGQPKGLFVISRDITRRKEDEEQLHAYATELKALNEKLELISITDALTEVYNRRQFNHQIEQEVLRAQRFGSMFSLALFDIDHFRNFNNQYGHLAGDRVLHEVAQEAKRSIRKVDILFRFGGEEFAMIFPETDLAVVTTITERLRGKIKSLAVSFHDQVLPAITISFGIVCSQGHELSSSYLIEAADKALYQAKADGRDCARIFQNGGVVHPPMPQDDSDA